MPLDLDALPNPASPDWRQASSLLQGNILKGHGRNFTALILIQFHAGAELRARVQRFSHFVISAETQAAQTQKYRASRKDGDPPDRHLFGNLFLSVWGYRKLGFDRQSLENAFPNPYRDPLYTNWFLDGMEHHGAEMMDPPRIQWESEYQQPADAMLLLACDDRQALADAVMTASAEIAGFGRALRIESGAVHRGANGRSVEHFGFTDSISQPEFFHPGPGREPLSIVLERDRLAGVHNAYGSFLVYRKLEQNVKGFRAAERELARRIGVKPEYAAAMIVGRFRDGSPLTKTPEPGWKPAADNDFDYANTDDLNGLKCPFHAHIRKANPRTRYRDRIVRRGVSYGCYDPTDPTLDPPETGSGMLFLSFQRHIQMQFGLLQSEWLNRVDSPRRFTGKDPLASQGGSTVPQEWPVKWGLPETKPFQFDSYVTLKGGEFFFAPSLAFFANLPSL